MAPQDLKGTDMPFWNKNEEFSDQRYFLESDRRFKQFTSICEDMDKFFVKGNKKKLQRLLIQLFEVLQDQRGADIPEDEVLYDHWYYRTELMDAQYFRAEDLVLYDGSSIEHFNENLERVFTETQSWLDRINQETNERARRRGYRPTKLD